MLAHQRQRCWIEIGISLTLLVGFSVVVINVPAWVIETLPSTVKPTVFPRLISGILVFLCLSLTITNILELRKTAERLDSGHDKSPLANDEPTRFASLVSYVLVLFLYLFGMKYLGFLISTPVAMFAVALLLGLQRRIIGLVVYVILAFVLNYVALNYMQIILPPGILFE